MDRIFNPRSIVVIGVSDKPENLARNILVNLCAFSYPGELYGIGRVESVVEGVEVFTSFDKLPMGVDLAVILTPAALVPGFIDACGERGITRIVIESGGFSERSEEGGRLEAAVRTAAERWGIRFVGPNCISAVNLKAGVCLPFAGLSPETMKAGPVSVIAQSGGISIAYLERLSQVGVGASKVISIGNKTDLDENDYLEYMLGDPETGSVVLYLESISDGRRFCELAQSSRKPIVVQKANRVSASNAIAFSHTAALASDDRIVDGVLRQCGVFRGETFQDVVTIVQGLSMRPVRGRELIILSRSGGHAVVAADAATQCGFDLPAIPESLAAEIRAHFRADVITVNNPMDLGAIFDFDVYASLVEHCLRRLSPDALLLLNTYGTHERAGARRLAKRVEAIASNTDCSLALCAFSQGEEIRALRSETSIQVFDEIEGAVKALATSRDWHSWDGRAGETLQEAEPGDWTTNQALHEGRGPLPMERAIQLCNACGIPTPAWSITTSAEEAYSQAQEMSYPCVLKILSPDLIHKARAGGVSLGLCSPDAVREAAITLLTAFGAGENGSYQPRLLLQEMVTGGLELILGVKRDVNFGPVVMFGLGGTAVETQGRVSFRLAPLRDADALALIGDILPTITLTDGERRALIESMLAISNLIVQAPELQEFEINPLILKKQGVWAVDARGFVGSSAGAQ